MRHRLTCILDKLTVVIVVPQSCEGRDIGGHVLISDESLQVFSSFWAVIWNYALSIFTVRLKVRHRTERHLREEL
jgi:hypothetical protein